MIPLFSKIKFVILTGENRVGKDTLANQIYKDYKKNFFNVQILNLSSPLKEEFLKEPSNRNKDLKDITVRKELFELSKKIKRVEGKSFFCRKLFEKIDDKTNVVIIPDMRFLEEYEYFKDNLKNIDIIKVVKKGNKNSDEYLVSYDVHKIPYDKVVEVDF